jgi:DNA-binding CsgD family transcriptional regulator
MVPETHADLSQLLSLRQREILELLRVGLTDVEIAERLDISASGVRYHVTEIINKLGVENRHEAANWPERPPWWATALAPAALLWKKASLVLPVKASSVALGLSGGGLAAAVGGLSLIGFLLVRANTDVGATLSEAETPTVASASIEPSTSDVLISSSPESLASAALDNTPEPPTATPSASDPQPAASSQSTNTPAPTPCSADACATATAAPVPTPLPHYPGGMMAVDCDADQAGIQSSCAYAGGATFHIQIHVTQAPSDGYFVFQSKLRWNDAQLGYLPASTPHEALWEECDTPARLDYQAEPSVIFGCYPFPYLAEGDTTTGAVLQLQFQCEEGGMTPLELVSREGDLHGGTFFLDGLGNPIDPLLADAQVVCSGSAPGPEPCPPDCPAPSPTPTAPTPAPAPGEPGSMAVDCAAATAGIQSDCQYASGASFSIQVHVTQPPSQGYFAFQTKLRWSDEQLDYLPASDPADSGLWHRCDIAAWSDGQPSGEASLLFGCLPFPALSEGDATTGAIVEFQFQCQEDGLTSLTLMPREGDPQGGTYFDDGFLGSIDPTLAEATIQCG